MARVALCATSCMLCGWLLGGCDTAMSFVESRVRPEPSAATPIATAQPLVPETGLPAPATAAPEAAPGATASAPTSSASGEPMTPATAASTPRSPTGTTPTEQSTSVPLGLSSREFSALLKAAGLKAKRGIVLNSCGADSDASFEELNVGGSIGKAIAIVLGGGDPAAGGMPCYGRLGDARLLRRLPQEEPSQPPRFEAILSVAGAGFVLGTERHLGVLDLEIAGPGFCTGVWRWDGKQYNHFKNVGPSCAMLEDESAATPGNDAAQTASVPSNESGQNEATEKGDNKASPTPEAKPKRRVRRATDTKDKKKAD